MAVIEIPDKICPSCGTTKWIVEVEKRKYGTVTRYRCPIKASARNKRWANKYPEKVLYYSEISSKRKTKSGYWKTEEYKKKETIRYHKNKDNLTDRFVKAKLAVDGLISQSDMPQELIELKRKQLILTRIIKNHGN